MGTDQFIYTSPNRTYFKIFYAGLKILIFIYGRPEISFQGFSVDQEP